MYRESAQQVATFQCDKRTKCPKPRLRTARMRRHSQADVFDVGSLAINIFLEGAQTFATLQHMP